MNHAEEVTLLKRCVELAQQGNTQLATEGGGSDVRRYRDPDQLARERKQIFRQLPMAVAHASQLAQPDSFLTPDSPWGSLLVTRDAEGEIRAFHNVCRHRGTRLVGESQGCAQRFTCPYHAWTYSNAGALIGVPHGEAGFPDLDRSASGLAPLDCSLRHGFVWVGATDAELTQHLSGIEDDLAWLSLDALRIFREERRQWRANWKLIAEGGLESYHFRRAHRATIAPHFYDNLSLYHRYGPHFRSVLPRRSLDKIGDTPPAKWKLREHTHLTYALFPSLTFLVQADHVVWITALPKAVDCTDIRIVTLVPKPDAPFGGKPETYWQTNHDITCATLKEDFALGESIQSGLVSGANTALRFGRNEGALTEFQRIVDGYCASPAGRENAD